MDLSLIDDCDAFMASCLPCPDAHDAADTIPISTEDGLETNPSTRGFSRMRPFYPPLSEEIPVLRTHWETRYVGHRMRSKVYFTGTCRTSFDVEFRV